MPLSRPAANVVAGRFGSGEPGSLSAAVRIPPSATPSTNRSCCVADAKSSSGTKPNPNVAKAGEIVPCRPISVSAVAISSRPTRPRRGGPELPERSLRPKPGNANCFRAPKPT